MSNNTKVTTKKIDIIDTYIYHINELLLLESNTKEIWNYFYLIIINIKNNNFDKYLNNIINIFIDYLFLLSDDYDNDNDNELTCVDILFYLFRERTKNVTRNIYIELMKILVHYDYFENYSSIIIILLYYYGSINDIKDIFSKNELISSKNGRLFSNIMYENYFSSNNNESIKEELKNKYNIVDNLLFVNNRKNKIILPDNVYFYSSGDESSQKIRISIKQKKLSKLIIKNNDENHREPIIYTEYVIEIEENNKINYEAKRSNSI